MLSPLQKAPVSASKVTKEQIVIVLDQHYAHARPGSGEAQHFIIHFVIKVLSKAHPKWGNGGGGRGNLVTGSSPVLSFPGKDSVVVSGTGGAPTAAAGRKTRPRSPFGVSSKRVTGRAMPRRARGPRVVLVTPSAREGRASWTARSKASEHTTCPPCATAESRAERLT